MHIRILRRNLPHTLYSRLLFSHKYIPDLEGATWSYGSRRVVHNTGNVVQDKKEIREIK